MWVIRAFLIFALLAAALGFLIYNATMDQRVSVNLYWWQFDNVPFLVTLFWAFLSGGAFTLSLSVGIYFRHLGQINAARRTIRGLKEEVSSLRNRSIEHTKDIFNQDKPAEISNIAAGKKEKV